MEMPATKTTISLRHKRNIRERVNLVGRLQYVLLQSLQAAQQSNIIYLNFGLEFLDRVRTETGPGHRTSLGRYVINISRY
jgi:hypothetical protein